MLSPEPFTSCKPESAEREWLSGAKRKPHLIPQPIEECVLEVERMGVVRRVLFHSQSPAKDLTEPLTRSRENFPCPLHPFGDVQAVGAVGGTSAQPAQALAVIAGGSSA